MKAFGIFATVLAATTLPQTHAQNMEVFNSGQPERSYAFVEDGSMRTFTGGMRESADLLRYVHGHNTGKYVIFKDAGSLHRLDNPAQIAELQRLYAPMRDLANKQQALARAQQPLAHQQQSLSKAQQPLAEQQRSLSDQQRSANNIDDHAQLAKAQGGIGQQQAEIGEVQGAVGQQQGELGQLQGELGRQQGEIARAANSRLQTMIKQCLKDGSCPKVAS